MGVRPLPGAVRDLTAARIWGILRELAASGLVVLADKGYAGPLSVELFLPKFSQGDPFEVAKEIRQKAEGVMRQARVM